MNLMISKPQTTSRRGIFGGSFNPFHLGHLHAASAIAEELSLDYVELIPAYIAPHKQHTTSQIELAHHRLAMLQRLCQQNALFRVNDIELSRQQVSYTVDTLRLLAEQQPKQQRLFLMGMDSLLQFTHWYQWSDILSLCAIVVMQRPNFSITQASPELQQLLQQRQISDPNQLTHGAIYITQTPLNDISSTLIRQRLYQQQPIDDLVPECIAQYILAHQLYQNKVL
jgi:nicotinate-nucleotide adenylyltransferase